MNEPAVPENEAPGSGYRSVRLRKLLERVLAFFGGENEGATFVEYLVIGGIVAFGAIAAFKRYEAHASIDVGNEAKIVASLGTPDPEAVIASLGGFDDYTELPSCDKKLGVCTPGSNQCFAASTLVATESGDRPIEAIHEGDLVWSKSETTGMVALRPVLRTFVTPDSTVISLRLTSDLLRHREETITVTPGHPFWIDGRGWARADELSSVSLFSLESSVRASALLSSSESVTVYNLEVEDFHTYFVGHAHAWVHNACFNWKKDCFDQVMALPYTTYKNRPDELKALCQGGYRYNPNTKRLYDPNAGDYGAPTVTACLKAGKTNYPTSNAFNAGRQKTIDARAKALCDGDTATARNISEQLGEDAAAAYGSANYPKSAGWSEAVVSSGPNVFDHVYVNSKTGQVVIIEAKGGDSSLGDRWDKDEQKRVQQGTNEYAEAVATAMKQAGNPLGQPILDALDEQKLQYVRVQQRLDTVDCNTQPPTGTAGNVEVSEFEIYNPQC